MKKLWIILLFLVAGTCAFCAEDDDLKLIIKGKTVRNRINVGKKENLSFRAKTVKQTTTLTFRTTRSFAEGKAHLKVKKTDEFSFSVSGGFRRDNETKRQYFHWVEIESLKINGTVLIGKGSKTNPEPLNVSKSKDLADKVKVRGNSELVIEIKFRETPKSDADALSEKEGVSDYSKAQKEKRDRLQKKREERKSQKNGGSKESGDEDSGKAGGGKKASAGDKEGSAASEDAGDNE